MLPKRQNCVADKEARSCTLTSKGHTNAIIAVEGSVPQGGIFQSEAQCYILGNLIVKKATKKRINKVGEWQRK